MPKENRQLTYFSMSRKLISRFAFLPERFINGINNAGLFLQKTSNTLRFKRFWDKHVKNNPEVVIVPSFAKSKSKIPIWNIVVSKVRQMEGRGKVVEFGVGNGGSLLYFWKALPGWQFIGYDCFEGIPEKWDSLPAGSINGYGAPIELWADFPEVKEKILATLTPGKFPAPPQENISIEAGLFSQTALKLFRNGVPDDIQFIHFDADIYTSTRPMLDMVAGPLNYRYFILFDEFYSVNHEFKAWMEFVDVYKIKRWRVTATSEDGCQVLIEVNY